MTDKSPIATLREKAGLTQAELSERIGVSENTIANWERGTASKWIRQLHRLCTTLHCTLDELDPNLHSEEHFYPLLGSNILDTVKSRCVSLSKGDRKAAAKIASYATLHDPHLRYWIDQADQVIGQWRHNFRNIIDCEIDCEAVINTLMLQNLLNQLNCAPPEQINYEKFYNPVRQVELTPEFLNRYITFSAVSFTRKLILQTRALTVYIIGWKPGQMVGMHHHGNSLDAIKVIEGERAHWLLSFEECEKQKIPFEGCSAAEKYGGPYETVKCGEGVFIDRRHAHQIQNLSDKNLVTLHFRFGAPPDDTNWSPPSRHYQHLLKWEQFDECIVVVP